MDRRTPAAGALGALAIALIAAGCGSSSSPTTSSAQNTVAAQTTSTTAPAPPKPHLRIVSPRTGAHTNGTVVVRVALRGTAGRGAHEYRYTLNGGRPRTGSARYTLTGLAPGRYRLVATLVGEHGVRASRVFVVRTPPPPPAPAPAQMTQTQTQAPPATTTTSSPPPAPPSSGIPQNNGGDMDADNNGGPSDGDGNV